MGTEEEAIFDFVIPRGEPGGGGAPEVLATVDQSGQPSGTGTALTFNDTPLVSGTTITHAAGSTDVIIHQDGIYQAIFQGTVSVQAGTPIPSTLVVQLYQNGVPVAGASARHTFTATGETATMSFDVPFRVTGAPATVQVVSELEGFTFEESALTVIRLGDAT